MRRRYVGVTDFLRRDVALLKLYNTYFRRTCSRLRDSGGVPDRRNTTRRNLFLHIEADSGYWQVEVEQLMAELADQGLLLATHYGPRFPQLLISTQK